MKENLTMKGKGGVGPGKQVAALPEGDVSIEVEWVKDVDGITMARVVYPDGFTKHHQVAPDNVRQTLIAQIDKQVGIRYGSKKFLKSPPGDIADGATLTYGD